MGENKRKPNSYKSGNSQNKKNTEKTNFDKKYKFEKKMVLIRKKVLYVLFLKNVVDVSILIRNTRSSSI